MSAQAKIDPAEVAASLSDDEVVQLAAALLELDKDEERQRWQNLFPDEGPLRRELYPRHMEFFNAGAKYRQRLFMGANRCVTPWTYIETPDGPVLSAELMTSTKPSVLSWGGESQCVRPMLDGILLGLEPAFRLVLDSGQFFDCNRRHQVLTTEGWLSLDQLMSRADGLRSWHSAQDYQASCDADGHLGDQPLRALSDIGLAPLPSLGGAQKRARLVFSPLDVAAHRFRYSHACRGLGRLSTRDDLHQLAGLFAPFSGASSSTPVLQLSGYSQVAAQLAPELALLGPKAGQFLIDQSLGASHDRAVTACGAAYMPARYSEIAPASRRSREHTGHHSIGGLSLHDGRRTAIFFPSGHPELVGGAKIIACVPLGYQPIVDAHVVETNNYISAGVVHHNSGKTVGIGFEVTCHLTGIYPHWWIGKRFDKPIDAWAAGDTNETTRDIIQKTLFGNVVFDGGKKTFDGTGVIPFECIGNCRFKPNTGDLLDYADVKHISGRWSRIGLKSYQQGREVFQGTAKDLIWTDEEPPMDVYGECLIRTTTTNGIMLVGFTPLRGMSEVVSSFVQPDEEDESAASRFYVQAGWQNVPHIDEATKAEYTANTPPHLRGARLRGEPSLGAGAVYQVDPDEITIAPFQIPAWFRRGYGFDVGWNRTAALWGAYDHDNDVLYLYNEHYVGQREPSVHADAIKARGKWIPGFIDPASQGAGQIDGRRLIDEYRKLDLSLVFAENAVEAGILECYQRLSSGRIRVFSTLTNFLKEYKGYSRKDAPDSPTQHGKIVKKNDHLMDCLRYLTMAIPQMILQPNPQASSSPGFRPLDPRTGY